MTTPEEIADRILERLPLSALAVESELIRDAVLEVMGEASIFIPRLEADDVLVLATDARLSEEAVARLKASWDQAMRSPVKHPIVVFEGGLKPAAIVARPAAGAES